MISYLVSKFAKGELSNLVKECFGNDFPDIFRKPQINYIYHYLDDLKAESVLLEPQYIDKDYLDDFNNYYVKCFSNNGLVSARLHFFSKKLNHQQMTECLAKGDRDEIIALQKSYLGFIVIKPLTKTFIGRTCLKVYPSFNKEVGSKKCLSREYSVDLFGIPLKITSIAFQEQDKVVSACATTAIWSSLHAMHWKNVRDIPSCSEITTNAINHIHGSSNAFPKNELSNKQIFRALDFEGLKYHVYDISAKSVSADVFFSKVKIYIDSKIPLILGVDVYSKNKSTLNHLSGHAVSIVGYKSEDDPSHRAIYIHDDRLGPFARARFIQIEEGSVTGNAKWGLIVQQKDDQQKWKEPHEVFVINTLIAPTPKKVRLSEEYTNETCSIIVTRYKRMLANIEKEKNKSLEIGKNLKFNIRLSEISEIRHQLFNHKYEGENSSSLEKEKVRFLTSSYARYHWIASFELDGIPIFKILFDATDIPQGNVVSGIFVENRMLTDIVMQAHSKVVAADMTMQDIFSHNFYSAFLKYIKPKPDTFNVYLDQNFGELRAPKYIKDEEMENGDILNSEVHKYYGSVDQKLNEIYSNITANDPKSFLIWTISHEGALLIGLEENGKGHPTLTGFKPSRIAGEMRLNKDNIWKVNSKSGRYSRDYENTPSLLSNAVKKIKDIFPNSRNEIVVDPYQEDTIIFDTNRFIFKKI